MIQSQSKVGKLVATILCGAALLGSVCSHAQVPSNPASYTRTSAFTYYGVADGAKAGLLKTEVVEPDNAQSCVTTTHEYDAKGNKVIATTSNCAGATGMALFTTRTSRSTYAAVAAQPIVVGGSTVNVAIPEGLVTTSSTNAKSQTQSYEVDPRFGSVIKVTDANLLVARVEVDDFGRKSREVNPDGTSMVYLNCVIGSGMDASSNSSGCPTPAAGEAPADAVLFVHSEPRNTANVKMGPFVRVYTDRLGREIRTVTESFDGPQQPAGRRAVLIARDTVYNLYGAKELQTQPYFLQSQSSTLAGSSDVGVTRMDYDVLGRVVAMYVADAQGSQASVSFGSYGSRRASVQTVAYAGLEVSTTNDKGQTRKEEKDPEGHVVRVTDAALAQVAHKYDAFGNLVATRDALQNQITLTFDIRGRKRSQNDQDRGLWTYDYDALGQLVWQQNPNQRAVTPAPTATTMAYDVLGRMTQRVDPEYTSTWYYDAYAGGAACDKGIGKLCASSTSHGVTRKFAYDSLGRPLQSRTDITSGPSVTSAVAYDTSTGRLASQTYPTGVKVAYGYTAQGYLDKLTLQTPATLAPLPATAGGTPGAGTTLPAGSVLWQAMEVNAWGKAEKGNYGNGVINRASFEAASGRIASLSAGAGAATDVLNHGYVWDSLNNLLQRHDNNGDGGSGAVSEYFRYDDPHNRLTSYRVVAPAIAGLERNVSLQYNALGMLLYKSDVGVYTYGTQGAGQVRPHALRSVAGSVNTSFTYDANGNMTGSTGGKYRSVAYTSFNLPDSQNGLQGPGGTPKYTWSYDESHARISEVRQIVGGPAAGTRTTWKFHPDNQGGLGFESEVNAPTTPSASNPAGTHNRHYLSVSGQSIGVLVTTGALPTLTSTQMAPPALASVTVVKLEYWHKDHLGSLAATTDHAGAVTARYAYDPFGKRRYTNGNYDEFGNLVIDWNHATNNGTDRGYTGHEHLDDVGLIHMNGRIFDPTLGVFLQPDPFVQDPFNLQNFNAYGYCFNNPLTCTDPSGHKFKAWKFFAGVAGALAFGNPFGVFAIYELSKSEKGRMVLSIAAGFALGPGGLFANGIFGITGVGQAAIAGFVSGTIAGGDLKSGLHGAFSAMLFYGAGEALKGTNAGLDEVTGAVKDWGNFAEAVALHGVVGCVTSVTAGGKCGSGALSAAFSKAAVPLTAGMGDIAQAATHSIIGGTASVIGGGKFANGAQTAAFSYLFNFVMHRERQINRLATESYDMSFEEDVNIKGGLGKGIGKRIFRGVETLEDAYYKVKCGMGTCYGHINLTGEDRAYVLEHLEPKLKALATQMAKDNMWSLKLLSRDNVIKILDAFQGVKDFTKYYGTRDQIMSRFPEFKRGSTCAHGDTECGR